MKSEKIRRIHKASLKTAKRYVLFRILQNNNSPAMPYEVRHNTVKVVKAEATYEIQNDGKITLNYKPTGEVLYEIDLTKIHPEVTSYGFGRKPKSKGQRKRRREALRIQQEHSLSIKDIRRL